MTRFQDLFYRGIFILFSVFTGFALTGLLLKTFPVLQAVEVTSVRIFIATIGLLVYGWNWGVRNLSLKGSIITDSIGLFLIYFISRLIWIYLFPNHVISDCSQYHDYAAYMANEREFIPKNLYMPDLFYYLPFKVGFPVFLSLFYDLFGANPFTGQMVNIMAGYLTAMLLYWGGYHFFSQNTGRWAALLFCLLPSYIVSSGHIGSEQWFTLFFILTFLVLYKAKKIGSLKYFAISGVLLSITYIFRPVIYPFLIAAILWLALPATTETTKTRFKSIFILVLSCFITLWMWSSVIEWYTGVNIQKSSPYFSLLMGSSFEKEGMADPDLANLFGPNIKNTEVCDYICKQRIIHNYKTHWKGLPLFLWKKFQNTWSGDDYGLIMAQWSMDYPKAGIWGQWFDSHYITLWFMTMVLYGIVLLLALLGIWFYPEYRVFSLLVMITTLGYFAFHMIVEAQTRYHYHIVALLMIPAGAAIARLLKSDTTRTQ